MLQMECEESIDEERSNFDLKLSAAISEEKALSDSEIKVSFLLMLVCGLKCILFLNPYASSLSV